MVERLMIKFLKKIFGSECCMYLVFIFFERDFMKRLCYNVYEGKSNLLTITKKGGFYYEK